MNDCYLEQQILTMKQGSISQSSDILKAALQS